MYLGSCLIDLSVGDAGLILEIKKKSKEVTGYPQDYLLISSSVRAC